MGYVYYIDESGNTGTNWLDATQPLLVHGGWLVPKNNVEGVRKELVSLFQLTQATVLKSKNVMNSKSKNKMIKMLFETMRRNGAVPFLTVSIKRFMISAKIVETFFDHQYNPNVNAKLTHPIELKKALAVCIYENDTYSIINKFSLLIQNRTASIADLRGISESLITLFDSRNHFLVARSLKNLSDDNFLEMIDEFETSEKNELALLMPGIFKLLTCVEIFSAKNRSPVDVYHDQLWGYSNIFELLRTTFLNKKILPINVGTNEKPILSGFEYIKSLEMKKDEDDVLLQLSDLLCGYAAKIFMKTIRWMPKKKKFLSNCLNGIAMFTKRAKQLHLTTTEHIALRLLL